MSTALILWEHQLINSNLQTDDELKIVLEGELHVTEPASGTTIVAKAGDLLNISNGASLEFNSPSMARIFVGGPLHTHTLSLT